MIKHLKFSELKQALEAYCSVSVYDHPFIIAGWSGIGKTALVEEAKKTFPKLSSIDYNLEEDDDATQNQIINEWSICPVEPKVLCITSGVNLAPLRDIMLAGCDIHILELDLACWLEWAKDRKTGFVSNVDPIMISFIERNPSLLHSNIPLRESVLSKADGLLEQLEEDDTSDFHKTFSKINELFILLQQLYLTRSEVKPSFDRMMDAFFSMQEKADDNFNALLLKTVIQIGTLHAKQFIQD